MKFGTMKYCIMTAAGALLSLAGCVMNRAEDYDPAVDLAFSPQLYVPVRAGVQQGSYPEELPFGVSAWMLPAGQSFADHATEAREFLTRCQVAYDDGNWLYEPPKEWSSKTTRLSFIGYAPYGAAAGCDAERGALLPTSTPRSRKPTCSIPTSWPTARRPRAAVWWRCLSVMRSARSTSGSRTS